MSIIVMQRFYTPTNSLSHDEVVSDDHQLIWQLTKVLRAKVGDQFVLFDGSPNEYLVELIVLNTKSVRFRIIKKSVCEHELNQEIIVCQSLIKSEKFEWLLQKCAELGVAQVVPVVSERSVLRDLSIAKRRRGEDIIKEATEQCGGCRMMTIGAVIDFENACQQMSSHSGIKLIAWEKETSVSLAFFLAKARKERSAALDASIFVGPEGGYTQAEIELASNCGISPISLGRRILRAETAAIAAVSSLILDA